MRSDRGLVTLSRARLAFAAHDATLHTASDAVGTLHVNRQAS